MYASMRPTWADLAALVCSMLLAFFGLAVASEIDTLRDLFDGPQALGATVIAVVGVVLAWVNKFRAH